MVHLRDSRASVYRREIEGGVDRQAGN
jgi:hypothetical protein